MLHARTHLGVRARCETSWFDSAEVRTPRGFDVRPALDRSDHYELPGWFAPHVYSSRNPWYRPELAVGDDVFARVEHGWAWAAAFFQRAEYPLGVRTALAERLGRALGPRPDSDASSEVIGVHVRLGDYVSDPLATAMMGRTGPSYYADAVADLRSELGDLPVRVFTDSPDLVADVLAGVPGPLDVAPFADPWSGLRALSSCAALVLSNSTFSWWAAFVATVLDDRTVPVVMPEPWYAEPSPADDLLWVPGWRRRERPVGR